MQIKRLQITSAEQSESNCRLMRLAEAKKRQQEVVKRLLEAFFAGMHKGEMDFAMGFQGFSSFSPFFPSILLVKKQMDERTNHKNKHGVTSRCAKVFFAGRQ